MPAGPERERQKLQNPHAELKNQRRATEEHEAEHLEATKGSKSKRAVILSTGKSKVKPNQRWS